MEKGDLVQVSVLGGIETLRYLDQSGEVFFAVKPDKFDDYDASGTLPLCGFPLAALVPNE